MFTKIIFTFFISFKNTSYKVWIKIITRNYNKKNPNSLKNIALTLLVFMFEQFVDEQIIKTLQFASIPDTIRGKINLCETLKTIQQSISRFAFQSKKGECMLSRYNDPKFSSNRSFFKVISNFSPNRSFFAAIFECTNKFIF